MVVTNKVSVPNYPDLYLNGTKLQKVHSHKHLGVTLTSNMKWGVHIDAAIAKANKRLNGIRRIQFLITREARIILYKSLILPVLEYGNILYDNCTLYLKQRLENIQRQADYNLRNSNHISIPKTLHVKTYNSFISKTIRDWNSLGDIKNCKSVVGFKTMYKREFFRKTTPIHNIDHDGGNIHITRLRLGLSHLKSHLYTHNLIDDPTCDYCGLQAETTTCSHYLLKCPTFAVQRAKFLSYLPTIIEYDYLTTLRDNDIVELFYLVMMNFLINQI